MKATLTELHKHTAEVIRPVRAGQTVTITEHGRAVAVIGPAREGFMDGKEWASKPLPDDVADALAELGKSMTNGKH